MRTTVDLDDALFRKAKAQAALRGIKFKKLVEDGLKLALDKEPVGKKPFRVKLPLFDKKGDKKVRIPANIVHRLDDWEDRVRHEASLRR
jgi:hypothetical protein